jgi:hypothetical protein
MNRIYIPAIDAEAWKIFLADPEKQWKKGYSARTLANCWQEADGFPDEVKAIFCESDFPQVYNLIPLFGFPEYKVPIPGGKRCSQTDLYVLAKDGRGDLVSIMIEGKVAEPFGPTIGDWLSPETKGKRERLSYIKDRLGIVDEIPNDIRYQLAHRTVSALIEADRVGAKTAIMLVHSFSQECLWFADFQAFVNLFGKTAEHGKLIYTGKKCEIDLYLGWVQGNPLFLGK